VQDLAMEILTSAVSAGDRGFSGAAGVAIIVVAAVVVLFLRSRRK
jgi:hypothetical protein